MTTIQQILDFATLYLDTMLASNKINQYIYDTIKNSLTLDVLDEFLRRIKKNDWSWEQSERAIKKYVNIVLDKLKDDPKPYEPKTTSYFYYAVVGIGIIGFIGYKVISKIIYN